MSSTILMQPELTALTAPQADNLHFKVQTDQVKKIVLDNGMTVLIYPNKVIPKVLLQIAYNVGSYIEDAGARGLAHALEHMIFKGTAKLSETDINATARKYGATYNAFTSMDVTSYFFEADKNNWQPFMDILADCMQNARFDQQHLASEIKAVIQELKMYKDNYWSMMIQMIHSLEYPANHPYHYPVIGYKEDLMNLSADNLKKFYKKHYQPDRATLFIVGDVSVDEAIDLVNKNFGPIVNERKGALQSNESLFPVLPQKLQVHQTCFYEDVKTELLGFYWRIQGLKSNNEILSSAAAFLLGGGEGSRLYRALVEEHKVASSVMVFPHKTMESGLFLIFIQPMPGKAAVCRDIVESELHIAMDDGFGDSELSHMVFAQGKSFYQKLERMGSNFTYEWLMSFFATGDEYAIFNRAKKYSEITSEEVQLFLQENLDPFLMNQIEVLPMPADKRATSERVKQMSDDLDKKILANYKRTSPVEEPRAVYALAAPKAVEFTFPKPERDFELSNGLRVLLRTNNAFPLLSLQCTFKNATYFASTKEGLEIDLMMNSLMEASKGLSKQENVNFFESFGADYYFRTSGAGLSLLSADYKSLFERFVHVLFNPLFPADALEKNKAIVLEGLNRSKDDAQDVGIRQLKNMIYKNHPFSWQVDDALDLIAQSSVQDMVTWHKQHVTPSNMVLSVVGDFDLAEMEQVIRDLFEKIPQGVAATEPSMQGSFVPREAVSIPMVRDQVVLLMGQPSPLNIYHQDIVPVRLLNYIGFHSLGSRVFQLREQSGLFYTAFGGWAKGASKEPGFDLMGAIVSPENAQSVEKQMRALVDKMATNGVTEEELESARRLYLKQLIDFVATNSAVADCLASLAVYDFGFDYYDNVLARTQTISLAEINQICAKYFTTDKMATVKVGRV